MSSAVRSPISTLYLCLICSAIASSILSPATRTERENTTPASEITATSVVPPPISTIMLPDGSVIGRAAEHLLGFGADGENAAASTRVLPDRHHRGFIAYDTLALDVDKCVGGSQINGEIFRKPAKH